MRISDWSSDVCSSDLLAGWRQDQRARLARAGVGLVDEQPLQQRQHERGRLAGAGLRAGKQVVACHGLWKDRKSVVEGKSVVVRVALGGRRIMKQKKSEDYGKI